MENSSDDEPSGCFRDNHHFKNSFLLFSEYKRLRELDPDTKDKVGSLLSSEKLREVAYKFGMERVDIENLQTTSADPGRSLMEFLETSRPDLKVYHFCKVLKEGNIQRFDIINVLLDHLSVPAQTE